MHAATVPLVHFVLVFCNPFLVIRVLWHVLLFNCFENSRVPNICAHWSCVDTLGYHSLDIYILRSGTRLFVLGRDAIDYWRVPLTISQPFVCLAQKRARRNMHYFIDNMSALQHDSTPLEGAAKCIALLTQYGGDDCPKVKVLQVMCPYASQVLQGISHDRHLIVCMAGGPAPNQKETRQNSTEIVQRGSHRAMMFYA